MIKRVHDYIRCLIDPPFFILFQIISILLTILSNKHLDKNNLNIVEQAYFLANKNNNNNTDLKYKLAWCYIKENLM